MNYYRHFVVSEEIKIEKENEKCIITGSRSLEVYRNLLVSKKSQTFIVCSLCTVWVYF